MRAVGRFDGGAGHTGPILGQLHGDEGSEIEAFDAENGTVQPAQPLGDAAVDLLIVECGRGPARAADDAEFLQRLPFPEIPAGGVRLGALTQNAIPPLG